MNELTSLNNEYDGGRMTMTAADDMIMEANDNFNSNPGSPQMFSPQGSPGVNVFVEEQAALPDYNSPMEAAPYESDAN